jgi:large subunit ribosomal protein L9
MKVILLKDVSKIGKKYDIKNVADGFALNHLIPQGKAKVATDTEVKKIEALKKVEEGERRVQMDLIMKNVSEVDKKEIKISAKANDKGHLFAQLHVADIVKAIKDSVGADISEDMIVLSKPIKETGDHDIVIKIGDKKASINLVVEAI